MKCCNPPFTAYLFLEVREFAAAGEQDADHVFLQVRVAVRRLAVQRVWGLPVQTIDQPTKHLNIAHI